MSELILWQDAVTDRKQSDIDTVNSLKNIPWDAMTAEQKTAWSRGLKGAMNKADFERIENNIHLLSQVLELDLITYDGNIPYIPTISYWQNLLSNVETIRTSYSIHSDTPTTPELPVNRFTQINDIEKILMDVYEIILSNFFYESIDEVTMGDEIGLVL